METRREGEMEKEKGDWKGFLLVFFLCLVFGVGNVFEGDKVAEGDRWN